MAQPVRLRDLAEIDLHDAAEHYRQQAGERTALDFIDAVERSIRRIGRNPRIGSSRFAHELAIPDLRAWRVSRFPYALFYVVTTDVVDVWRILHIRRDIPAALRQPDE